MIKYTINKNFSKFKEFLLDIKHNFNSNQNTIHKARNEIKIIEYNSLSLVIKSFKIPHLLNSFIYSYFRDTKAKKSYEYSLRIGDFTPKPIGYIEFYKNSLLKDSYFVSENFKYDFTIREPLLDDNFKDKEEILKAFARFTFELHEAEILHQDYSPGNILIKKENDTFIFKIVDINRMKFLKLDLASRLKNFAKLWISDNDLKVVIKEYAKLVDEDEKKCLNLALDFSHKHKAKINLKKRLKGIEVVD